MPPAAQKTKGRLEPGKRATPPSHLVFSIAYMMNN